jgi:hypothetical protein
MTDSIWIKDTSTVPGPAGWSYPAIVKDGEAQTFIKVTCWDQLCGKVSQHYRTNGRTVPTCEEVTKWVCDNLPVPCYQGRHPYRNTFTDPPSYAERGLKSPNWPLILLPLKLLAQPGDRGLGDIVERTIGPIGGEIYKSWYKRIFGKPCGCQERKENLNSEYPL